MPKNKPRSGAQHASSPQTILPFPNNPDIQPNLYQQRSTSQLNLSVLQRHNPAVASILSVAPYAVVYTFNTQSHLEAQQQQQEARTPGWEKTGVEGTLFVVSLSPQYEGQERYGIVVLNRRGLENFVVELAREEDVEVTDEFVILHTAPDDVGLTAQEEEEEGEEGETANIYGLWIFSGGAEDGIDSNGVSDLRKLIVGVIVECAERAETSWRRLHGQPPGQFSLQSPQDSIAGKEVYDNHFGDHRPGADLLQNLFARAGHLHSGY